MMWVIFTIAGVENIQEGNRTTDTSLHDTGEGKDATNSET